MSEPLLDMAAVRDSYDAPQPIRVPPSTAAILSEIVQRQNHAKNVHDAIAAELQSAVRVVLATLGAPDGWQLRIEPDGSMVAVAPVAPAAE